MLCILLAVLQPGGRRSRRRDGVGQRRSKPNEDVAWHLWRSSVDLGENASVVDGCKKQG
jgi:hypothetical protein